MRETFRVFDADSREVASRELEHEAGPLLIVRDGESVRFAASASLADEVLAALVRDEDGWTLASSDPARPILSGAKRVEDLHLLVGLPCRLGDFVVRIDREVADAGFSLVWRYAGSPVAVDNVVGGRNEVSLLPDTELPQVNSAVGGSPLFGFYQTADGFEVVTGESSADRLAVPANTLFAVGGFEGMFMTTGDAAAALKAKDPFAWPSRRIRLGLELACFALLALLAVGLVCQKRLMTQRAANAEYRGAVEVATAAKAAEDGGKDDVLVYNLTFFRTLPAVLTARPNAPTLDLIQRGTLLAADPGVAAKVAFLKDVRTIQETILSGRWEELRKTLASVNEATFVECDADVFLADAREVASSFTERMPQTLTEASEPGNEKGMEMLADRSLDNYRGLQDNLFMVGDVIRREYDLWLGRIVSLRKYVAARNRVLADKSGEKMPAASLSGLYDAYADVLGSVGGDTAGFEEFNRRESALMRKIVDSLSAAVVARVRADELGTSTILLTPLSNIAELLEYPPATVAGWRALAKSAAKKVDAHCRKLYSSYRLVLLTDRARADRILDEILAVGDTDNGFRKWAEKEKQRRTKGDVK